jgi:hypothetical protein
MPQIIFNSSFIGPMSFAEMSKILLVGVFLRGVNILFMNNKNETTIREISWVSVI